MLDQDFTLFFDEGSQLDLMTCTVGLINIGWGARVADTQDLFPGQRRGLETHPVQLLGEFRNVSVRLGKSYTTITSLTPMQIGICKGGRAGMMLQLPTLKSPGPRT